MTERLPLLSSSSGGILHRSRRQRSQSIDLINFSNNDNEDNGNSKGNSSTDTISYQSLTTGITSFGATLHFSNNNNINSNNNNNIIASNDSINKNILIISEASDVLHSYTFEELLEFLTLSKIYEEKEKYEQQQKEKEQHEKANDNVNNNDDNNNNNSNVNTQSTTTNKNDHIPKVQFKVINEENDNEEEDGALINNNNNNNDNNNDEEEQTIKTHMISTSSKNKEGKKKYKQMIKSLDSSKMTHIITHSYQKNLKKPCWIDLYGLSETEIKEIGIELGLHELTIEEIISNDTPEKCEECGDYIFIVTSELQSTVNDHSLKENTFYILLFKSRIVVFHRSPLTCFATVLRSFRYLGSDFTAHISSSQWLLFAFFDAINEIYAMHTDQIITECEILEDFSFGEVEFNGLWARLGRACRKATHLQLALIIKTDILSVIIREEIIDKETLIYLSNVKDRAIRIKQNIKLLEELLENLKSVYVSKVSLLLNEESHGLNVSMRKFTSLSLIFMPLNLVAAIFGMNVQIPGTTDSQKEEVGFLPFSIIILFILSVGLINGIMFRRLGWL